MAGILIALGLIALTAGIALRIAAPPRGDHAAPLGAGRPPAEDLPSEEPASTALSAIIEGSSGAEEPVRRWPVSRTVQLVATLAILGILLAGATIIAARAVMLLLRRFAGAP